MNEDTAKRWHEQRKIIEELKRIARETNAVVVLPKAPPTSAVFPDGPIVIDDFSMPGRTRRG
jgi:hypothetical protein